MNEEIKSILLDSINVERWVPKSNLTYPFIDEEERLQMVENILNNLKNNGYTIIKKGPEGPF